ncbi:MAG: hypothetical protein HYV27_19790 [Candidatus Hydrogenedentes bacterium]|nr:hypothetical protein [Candidatus Hydrogenedentota bacterium]
MNATLKHYLDRATTFTWQPEPVDVADMDGVVVIPALAESNSLLHTLGDLAANSRESLRHTMVLVVVNNRPAGSAAQEDIDNNQRTLGLLTAWRNSCPELRLTWIDASSPGRELAVREGVGLARKIGLDWGARWLAEANREDGALICLDADTRVQSNYLGAIRDFYSNAGRWAAVVDYAHPLEHDGHEHTAIIRYEIFLRYCELGLLHAASPYAYPSIGSTISCTAKAYAYAGGMKRRQAGEDFYFLEKLAKTGHISRLYETTVIPAARASHRVPFGTGRSMQAFATGGDELNTLYRPGIYSVLKDWFALATEMLEAPPVQIERQARGLCPELAGFLTQQRFREQMAKLQTNAGNANQLKLQFLRWFDAFRTMKCMHHLRDSVYPDCPLSEAVCALLSAMNMPVAARPGERELLLHLRDICHGQREHTGGLYRP